jgi:hypothetical protein
MGSPSFRTGGERQHRARGPDQGQAQVAALDVDRLTYGDCANLYRGDKMAAKVIDIPAAEMVREWFDVLVEGTEEAGEDIEKRLKELGAKSRLQAGAHLGARVRRRRHPRRRQRRREEARPSRSTSPR